MKISFKSCLFYTQTQGFFFILCTFSMEKHKHDTIGILSALRIRGLHDKRHLLAKLSICGSEKYGRKMSARSETHLNTLTLYTALCYSYPGCSPAATQALKSISRELNSYWIPNYYTWIKRVNCGQNALSTGIIPQWDSNRPSDFKSRARTTTPQCSPNPPKPNSINHVLNILTFWSENEEKKPHNILPFVSVNQF